MAEIRQLRYFVAVAERGSVSQAALDLHLSQSALSEALRKLEVELGVELLTRSSRGVSVTAAGAVLVDEAWEAIARFDAALAAVRSAAAGQTGRLRVGFEAAGAGPLSTQARARFAGVAVGHPLASRSSLSVDELTDEPIMWTRRTPRYWVDWWAVNPRPDGREPRWGPENENVEEMLEVVADGSAYCIVPASLTSFYSRPDLVWVPLGRVPRGARLLSLRRRAGIPTVTGYGEANEAPSACSSPSATVDHARYPEPRGLSIRFALFDVAR